VVPFIRDHFGMTVISMKQFIICMVTAFLSVGWFEIYKAGRHSKTLINKADHEHSFQ